MSQEIINHLSELGRLTNNPKYYVDIADMLAVSPYSRYKDEAFNIYTQCMNSYDLFHKVITDSYIKNQIDHLLNHHSLQRKYIFNQAMTVIIPTMWKADERYFRFIMSNLDDTNLVSKVIIIDNNPEGRFKLAWETYSKVEIISDGVDRKVNPAWNYGISLTNTKYYLLLNDDCLIASNNILDAVNILENDPNVGLVNFHTKDIDPWMYYNSYSKPTIEYVNNVGNYLGGWCMCGITSEYKPIDERLLIFYGDNYIHHNVKKSGKRVVQLISGFVSHALSKTVCAENIYAKGYLGSEGIIYQEILNNEI